MRVLISALVAMTAWALTACGAAPAAQAPAPRQGAALWHIRDADSDIWLFGTAHELPEGVQWRGTDVEAAFQAAEEIVTETDTSPPAVAEYQRLATALGMLPAGRTLFDNMAAEDRARLDRVAQASNLQGAQFTQVRPWLAALQLSAAYEATRGQTRENGAESVLIDDAREARKRRSFLETPAEQVHFLADLAPADEMRFLNTTLRQIEAESRAPAALEQTWARGETEALGAQLDAEMRAAGPAVYAALITNRNRRWADEVQRRLNGSGKVFIAVGAAHLIGDGSVVDLLRERGVTVDGP